MFITLLVIDNCLFIDILTCAFRLNALSLDPVGISEYKSRAVIQLYAEFHTNLFSCFIVNGQQRNIQKSKHSLDNYYPIQKKKRRRMFSIWLVLGFRTQNVKPGPYY